jgi:signal transduction histidine kinase
MLLGLAVVAGAGAFLLIRGMRREAELAQLKTSFVGRVSHELKTPLALIRMYGETLALGRAQEPDKVQHFAGIIARESDRLTAMIDNILDFSRIEAGRKEYERSLVELAPLLDDCLESYRSHLESQGFTLGKELQPELWAELDAGALTQAVVNLLSNARKYSTESKEIRLELRAAGDQAEIRVLDRGIGVPEAERERVFETFYRASTAGERRGAGLGLALIAHFVEAHAGSATCEAREGGGSVFVLRLPRLPEEQSPALESPPHVERAPEAEEETE